MIQKEREVLGKLVVTFYKNHASTCRKSPISHFVKARIPRSTLYSILKKYAEHGKNNFLFKVWAADQDFTQDK